MNIQFSNFNNNHTERTIQNNNYINLNENGVQVADITPNIDGYHIYGRMSTIQPGATLVLTLDTYFKLDKNCSGYITRSEYLPPYITLFDESLYSGYNGDITLRIQNNSTNVYSISTDCIIAHLYVEKETRSVFLKPKNGIIADVAKRMR